LEAQTTRLQTKIQEVTKLAETELKQYRVRLNDLELKFLIQAMEVFTKVVKQKEQEIKRVKWELRQKVADIKRGNVSPDSLREFREAKQKVEEAMKFQSYIWPYDRICACLSRRLKGLLEGKRFRSGTFTNYFLERVLHESNEPIKP